MALLEFGILSEGTDLAWNPPGVMVSTLEFEDCDLSSNPSKTLLHTYLTHTVIQ